MPSSLIIFYVPIDSLEQARNVAAQAVKGKLAACVNIIDGLSSCFEWQGDIQWSKEYLMLFKTSEQKRHALRGYLEGCHPYECPCIIEVKPSQVNELFEAWLNETLSDSMI